MGNSYLLVCNYINMLSPCFLGLYLWPLAMAHSFNYIASNFAAPEGRKAGFQQNQPMALLQTDR